MVALTGYNTFEEKWDNSLDDINNMMSKLGQVYLDYTQARINVITV
jgi:hypothetical protein